MLEPNDVLAERYELISHIARGGMADVWRARDNTLNRTVAVKILHNQYANDDSFIKRFRREAQAAANLNHPNIVAIFDWGQQESIYFIVMELVEGRSLRDVLRSEGALLPRRATEIAAETAAALTVAHRAGIVHRDVKPGNILLTTDGTVKVTDFGIARAWDDSQELTKTGAVIGTATYFSPEQAQGHPADHRSDVYSVGVVLYEMLTGNAPFKGDSPVAVAYQHVSSPVVPPRMLNPDVTGGLEAITLKALEKAPELRYQSSEDLRADLLSALAGETIAPVTPSPAFIPPPIAAGQSPVMADAPTRVLTGTANVPPTVTPDEAYRQVEEGRQNQIPFIITAFAMLAVLAFGIWLVFNAFGGGGSDGADSLEIPALAGISNADASDRLQELGFRTRIEPRTDSSIGEGLVIETDPAAGEFAAKGTQVIIYSSTGSTQVQVPDLRGKTEAEARNALAEVNLVLNDVISVPSADVPAGFITTSNPEALSPVSSGFPVDIFLSTGPGTYVLGADYRGQSLSAVRFELEDKAGMIPTVVTEFDDEIEEGLVTRTDPSGPAELEVGSNITIYISAGPEPHEVPDLTGKTQQEAAALLEPIGLTIEIIGTTQDGVPGQITAQSPNPGTLLAPGGTVTVIVAVEPDSGTVTLEITIINNDGGTATAANIPVTLDGSVVVWNSPIQVSIGNHLASAAGLSGYTVSVWSGSCTAGGSVTVAPNDDAVCSITFDDIPVVTTTTLPPVTTTTP